MTRPPPKLPQIPGSRSAWLEKILLNSMKKKLSVGVSLGLIVGIGLVLSISNSMGLKVAQADAELNNHKLASNLAQLVKGQIEISNTRARSWIVASPSNESLKKQLEGDASILGIEVWELGSRTKLISSFQEKLGENVHTPAVPDSKMRGFDKSLNTENSKAVVYEILEINRQFIHRVSTPLVVDTQSGIVLKVMSIYLDPDIFKAMFSSTDIEELFMFDEIGNVIVRSAQLEEGFFKDRKLPESGKNLLLSLQKSQGSNKQQKLLNENKDSFFVGIQDTRAGVYVAVSTPEAKILEKISTITKRSMYLGLALLSISLWFTLMFADSIVQPVCEVSPYLR